MQHTGPSPVIVHCFWAPGCQHVEGAATAGAAHAQMEGHYAAEHRADIAAITANPEPKRGSRGQPLCDRCRQCRFGYHCGPCGAAHRARAQARSVFRTRRRGR